MQLSSKIIEHKYGYIPLREFIVKLDNFTTETGWRIPLSLMDRVHLKILRWVNQWSWFSSQIHIKVSSPYGIGFEQLINYLHLNIGPVEIKQDHLDSVIFSQFQWRMAVQNHSGLMENLSQGAAGSEHVALSKTLGEGLERFCTLRDKSLLHRNHVTAIPRTLKKGRREVYFPQDYHTYLPEQMLGHDYLGVKSDTAIAWVRGQNLLTKKSVWLPKQILSAQCQKVLTPTEGMIHQTTTNGSAGWFTRTGAVTRAIFELIQRDAFLTSWLKKEVLDSVDISTIQNKLIRDMCQKINRSKATIQILVADTESKVPTAIVTVIDKAFEHTQVYVTANTAATFDEAMYGAVSESLGFFRKRDRVDLPIDYKPFLTGSVNRLTRLTLCSQPAMVEAVIGLHSGHTVSAVEVARADFKAETEAEVCAELLDRLQALGEGYIPYVFDYSHPVLTKTGYHVVKCFVPNLFPLYLNEHMATILSKAIHTENAVSMEQIYKLVQTYPHPFP